MAPHRIFLIAEMLEQILLHTDLPTLLTSAQRVSRTWHELIQESPSLQMALFFRPSAKPVQADKDRRVNPFLPFVWDEILRKRSLTALENQCLDPIDPRKEAIYLAPEASWRRMLIRQPPSFRVGVAKLRTWFEPTRISSHEVNRDSEFLRLGALSGMFSQTCIVPGPDPRVLWNPGFLMYILGVEHEEERERARSEYLAECDFVLFDHPSLEHLQGSRFRCLGKWARWLAEDQRAKAFISSHFANLD